MTQLNENSQITSWQPELSLDEQLSLSSALEAGQILYFPKLAFQYSKDELPLLDLAPTKSKNISFNRQTKRIGGIDCEAATESVLQGFMSRYAEQALQLVLTLFPKYQQDLQIGLTSLRTVEAQGRKADSFRKDDTRLHVDAFPSRPMQGKRLLRVFSNVNVQGEPRVWNSGESFENVAQRFILDAKRYSPLLASLRNRLGITKSYQTRYDHTMLALHNLMKESQHYQKTVEQKRCEFAAGSVWIVFSDQVSHAVISGRQMMEQTFYLPVNAMYQPETSPLRVLERLSGQVMV